LLGRSCPAFTIKLTERWQAIFLPVSLCCVLNEKVNFSMTFKTKGTDLDRHFSAPLRCDNSPYERRRHVRPLPTFGRGDLSDADIFANATDMKDGQPADPRPRPIIDIRPVRRRKIATKTNDKIATLNPFRKTDFHDENQWVDENVLATCLVVRFPDTVDTHKMPGSGKRSKRKKTTCQTANNAGRKPWKKATADDKLASSVLAAREQEGIAFSLNLSPEREDTLRNSTDPARLLSGYINREMRAVMDIVPPYTFAFDISPNGRLHIHGVAVVHRNDLEKKKIFKKALMRAGGKLPGRSASTQCKFEKLDDTPDVWIGYVLEDIRKTRKKLATDKVTFISKGMRGLAREACLAWPHSGTHLF
jgi:hypothetical protein